MNQFFILFSVFLAGYIFGRHGLKTVIIVFLSFILAFAFVETGGIKRVSHGLVRFSK